MGRIHEVSQEWSHEGLGVSARKYREMVMKD